MINEPANFPLFSKIINFQLSPIVLCSFFLVVLERMLAKKGLLPLFYLGESGLIIKNRGRVTKLSWPFGAISQSN